jgi:adenylate cyclase
MMVVAFVFLLTASALPIIVFSFYQDKAIISALGYDLMEAISRAAIEKTNDYFMPASTAVQMSSKLAELGAISCNDYNQTEMYTMGVLQSYPQITMFYIGDEQGNYVHAWRRPGGELESWIVKATGFPPMCSLVIRDATLKVAGVEETRGVDYDPRERPWYVGAKTAGTNSWTDVYISYSSRKPTITSSYPVFRPDGKLMGVWGMDIEVGEICNFLHEQKIGKSGIELIIDEKNDVVAFPVVSSIIKEENGALRPVKVDELRLEPLTAAYREHLITGKTRSVIESGGKTYFASFTDFPKPFPMRWTIAVIVPEDDFTGGAKQELIVMLLISSVMLGVGVVLAVAISRGITHPVRLIAEATGRIRNFNLDEKIHIPSRMKEIQSMRDAIASMQQGLHAFRRYVPAELVRQLISTGEGAQLGGQKKELSVFFSDITGFTSIAELMTPEKLMLHLSEYFDELTKVLTLHGATVDKYIGDAVMAFWGAPISDENHAIRACEASLACQEKISELNLKWMEEGRSAFFTRIGISTGETVVGNVGSVERMNYTVMGDNVNMASRLESVNKLYGTLIIVSRRTYEQASEKFLFRPLGRISVKGKREKQEIYELVGKKTEDRDSHAAEMCEEFARGLNAYLSQNWDEALDIFARISLKFPGDAPTLFYLSRCIQFQDSPPGEDWQGIEYQTTK